MVVSLSFKNGGLSVLQEQWSLCPSKMVVFLSFKNGGLSVLQERWSLCPSRKMVPLSLKNRGLSILKEWWSLIRIVLHQGYHHNNFCVELFSLISMVTLVSFAD